jgi:pyruvate dehydrogenase E2 component (dihydrolipoamide acetyltransferase)
MIEVVVPQLGEAVSEVTITRWFKRQGDQVRQGDPLYEVDTEKSAVEIEAFVDGTLTEILKPAGSLVMPQQVVALIASADESTMEEIPSEKKTIISSQNLKEHKIKASSVAKNVAAELGVKLDNVQGTGIDGRIMAEDLRTMVVGETEINREATDNGVCRKAPASPKAKRLARKLGKDISRIVGTGVDGLITAGDVEAAADASSAEAPLDISQAGHLPFSKLRRTIAKRMQESKQTVPHFYLMVDVDMRQVRKLREYCREKLGWDRTPTYTDIIVRACGLAMAALPAVNVIYSDSGLVRRNTVDIGIAVGVDGGLLVPVLQRVDRLSLRETSEQISGLAERARKGRLRDTDLSQKSMVVSNLGMYGIDAFIAIIDIPDPMILAIGRISDRIVPVDGKPEIRPISTFSLSLDHRVLDGTLGSQFLTRVKNILENPYEILGVSR